MFLDGVNGALPVGPTLKLAPDAVNGQESGQSGALSATGFAGCGDFTTPATRAGVSIRFTMPTPAPKESCPSEVRILENQYITALSAARRLTIRGGYLVLMDEGGRDRAYFVPG
jgi:heat shock protein HslJ